MQKDYIMKVMDLINCCIDYTYVYHVSFLCGIEYVVIYLFDDIKFKITKV